MHQSVLSAILADPEVRIVVRYGPSKAVAGTAGAGSGIVLGMSPAQPAARLVTMISSANRRGYKLPCSAQGFVVWTFPVLIGTCKQAGKQRPLRCPPPPLRGLAG